jgi:hypothetical protein
VCAEAGDLDFKRQRAARLVASGWRARSGPERDEVVRAVEALNMGQIPFLESFADPIKGIAVELLGSLYVRAVGSSIRAATSAHQQADD